MGLGTIVAGGGAALGTGAFSSVSAQRSVTIDTAGDASALIALKSNSEYADTTGETIEFDLTSDSGNISDASGLNIDATTTLAGALSIENNSNKTVNITSSSSVKSGDIEVNLSPDSTQQLNPTSSDDSDVQDFDIVINTTGSSNDTFDVTLTITATSQ